jgi:hypothetical protein
MSHMQTKDLQHGWPATAVIRLQPQKPVAQRPHMATTAEDVVLAAVQHPPRIGEIRPLAALLPQVLARYSAKGSGMSGTSGSLDFAAAAADA